MKNIFGIIVFACIWAVFQSCEPYNNTKPDTGAPQQIQQSSLVEFDGIRILHLKGDHYQRGYGHGYLAGADIHNFFNGVIWKRVFGKDDSLYQAAKLYLQTHVQYDSIFVTEAKGLIEGMKDKQSKLVPEDWAREMDYSDILLMNSMEEIYTIVPVYYGCTSLSSWGKTTRDDSLLQGELVLSRHWDYPQYPEMIENLIVIVHHPSDPGEVNWINIGWAGLIGSYSAISVNEVGAFLHYDDHRFQHLITSTEKAPFQPLSLSIRLGIEKSDFDGNGISQPMDVVKSIQKFHPLFSNIIHIAGSIQNGDSSLVLEGNNELGYAIRRSEDNTVLPENHLMLANHFRLLSEPTPGERWKKMSDSLSAAANLTLERQRNVLAGSSGWAGTIYRLQYAPSLGRVWVSFAKSGIGAHLRDVTELSLDSLFND